MAVYATGFNTFSYLSQWKEQHLYGSARLGMINTGAVHYPVPDPFNPAYPDPIDNGIDGLRTYELSNHLGNVLATITDRLIQVDEDQHGIVDYYDAEVLSAQDYYPGGMQMPGRKNQGGTESYRYGFNGMEKSNEIKGEGNSYTAEFWEYDPRTLRRWNVDPKPNLSISVYNTFAGNPILYSDHLGDSSVPSFGSRFLNFVNSVQSGELQKDIVVGAAKAGKDAVVGAYNFVTKDAWKAGTYSNLSQLILTLASFDKPDDFRQAIDQTFQTNLQGIYTNLKEKFDVNKWSAKDWSYNLTSLAIALYGPKAVKDFKTFGAPLSKSEQFINLASKERTAHILFGDATGGGHAWFGSTKSFTNGILGLKSMFPASWSNAKIMHAISEVTVNNPWVQKTGKAGEMFTKNGNPVRFEVIGQFEGRTIKVITTHTQIL